MQRYEIIISGHIDERWSDWLHGMTIEHLGRGESRLLGLLPDQAALHGVLGKLRDMALPLVCVRRLEEGESS